jgi:hypothetical protein
MLIVITGFAVKEQNKPQDYTCIRHLEPSDKPLRIIIISNDSIDRIRLVENLLVLDPKDSNSLMLRENLL